MDWHSCSALEALQKLEVTKEAGLSPAEVEARKARFGLNKLSEKKKRSLLVRFLSQFSDFMVIILLIAAIISFITAAVKGNGDYIDPVVILLIVIVNAITGMVQESKAEKALEALKKLSSPEARVMRSGKEQHIPSQEIVPGDILLLDTGDFISADARLLESFNLKTEESALTGESFPVEKEASAVFPPVSSLADRKNLVFATSTVLSGHAVAVAVETGMRTEVGKIAHLINEEKAPETPLQRRLAQTGKLLGICAVLICLAIFLMGLIQHISPLEMFMISISLAVAAIPEGLPAVVTIVLALGVRRMAVSRAIIRRLPAVETLGSASVICSDKTGTLTQNKMTVTEVCAPGRQAVPPSQTNANLLSLAALCNNSTLSGPYGQWVASGDPTETALLLAAAKTGKVKAALDNLFPRVGELPFDSKRKLMTTVHQLGGGRYRIITKGAPDLLLGRCSDFYRSGEISPLTPHARTLLEKQNDEMASRALRVLGVAFRDVDFLPRFEPELEKELVFCGFIGMIDPPRPQAKEAVRLCLEAGIRPIMITGDHVITAKAIARNLGILSEKDKALTGAELDALSEEELKREILHCSVFARVSPEHKVRIVKAFQSHGEVVAMTGDGVNDAPALKAADIGCAMGLSGTDVAKGAADMILTDDNFTTVVEAVRQGRGIFDNIKKTVHFLLSSNIGEILTVFAAFLFHLPAPLLAIQLLWVNLVTDSLPALSLGVEPVDKDIMKRPPLSPKKSLFAGGMGFCIAVEGCLIGALSLLSFSIGRAFFDSGTVPSVGRTMAFAVLSLSQLVHAFNVRSERSLFETGFFSNFKMVLSFFVCLFLQVSVIAFPPLSALFKTVPLNSRQWLIVALLSLIPLIAVELEKNLLKRKTHRKKLSIGTLSSRSTR